MSRVAQLQSVQYTPLSCPISLKGPLPLVKLEHISHQLVVETVLHLVIIHLVIIGI